MTPGKILFLSILCIAAIATYCASQDSLSAYECFKCHDKVFGSIKEFAHPLFKEGKCKSCHSSYDTITHAEAVKPGIDTCLGCHPEEKLGRTHPVGDGVIDPNTNDIMTCVSSCHLPHSSDYRYQLPFSNNMELCLSCHKDF